MVKKIFKLAEILELSQELNGSTPYIRTTATAFSFNAGTNIMAVYQANVTRSLAVGAITPSATAGRIDASNDVVAYSTSDTRLKKDIKPIEDSLIKLLSISGVNYKWDPKFNLIHGYNDKDDVGVIAQEVLEILPEAVRLNKNGYYSVRYERLIPLLIEAIKEQQLQIDELKNRLK